MPVSIRDIPVQNVKVLVSVRVHNIRVEPLNRGHFGTSYFIFRKEVVLTLAVVNEL